MNVEESVVYRIISKKNGQALSLVSDASATGGLKVCFEATSGSPRQAWMFAKSGTTYRIYPYIASDLALTSLRQDAILAAPTGASNQGWELEQQGEGAYRLLVQQDSSNKNKLVASRDRVITQYYTDSWPVSEQWQIEALDLRDIPALTGGAGVDLTMGPTDHSTYIKAEGTRKAVMVFIDFSDTQTLRTGRNAEAARPADTVTHLLGDSREAETIFDTQSHGKFKLAVTDRATSGWKLLAKRSTEYLDTAGSGTRYVQAEPLLADVKAKFTDVTFADYDLIFVVQPKEAFELNPDTSYGFSPSYTRAEAVLFGADSYRNRYVNLVHEVGHQIGLPDLYPYGDMGTTLSAEFRNANVVHPVGCWSIMADMQHSESFLGWERHKLGWLDDARKVYLPESELSATPLRVTLKPLTAESGLSMVVIPLDSVETPSKVLVIEIGQDVYGVKTENDKLVRDGVLNDKKGVLLYTVDATIASGAFPVKIIPRVVSKSDQFGELYEAPFADTNEKTYKDDKATFEIKMTVSKNADDTYTVALTKNTPAA